MAKIRKRKRKTNKLEKFAVWFFTIAIIAATATSLFVGTYNTNLTTTTTTASSASTTIESKIPKNSSDKLEQEQIDFSKPFSF